MGPTPLILAAVEEQRPVLRGVPQAQHRADEDGVVATVIGVADLALEAGQRSRQDRAAGIPGLVVEPRPLVLPRPGEALGQRLPGLRARTLTAKLWVDRNARTAVGAPVEADKDEGRIERNRVERVGRDPDRFAPRVEAASRRAGGPGTLRPRM